MRTIRTATPERTKITDTPFAGKFDEHDLWDLWLLDEAEEVPCGSIRTFLHYLGSKGTKHCEILDASTLAMGFVDVRPTGPLADDERNHLLHYRLTRGNVGRLKEAERDLLVSKLIKHYPTEGDEPHQKVRLALTAVGLSGRVRVSQASPRGRSLIATASPFVRRGVPPPRDCASPVS